MSIEKSIVFNFHLQDKKSHVDDGAACPVCSVGTLAYHRPDDCACHIFPPCSACVDAPLRCDACLEEFDDR